MALAIEVRERQKHVLQLLLTIKKENPDIVIVGLQGKIIEAVSVMDAEDVVWVEKIVGIKALEI